MPLCAWSRIKPLKDPATLTEFESTYQCKMSEALKQCILAYNGGRPTPDAIKAESGQEFDVKLLLSFNKDGDQETVYKVMAYFFERYHGTLIPFAADSAGNYYCESESGIVLWTQDEDILPVCESFSVFLTSLHEI